MLMQLTQKQIIIVGGIGTLIVIFVLMFLGIIPGLQNSGTGPVTRGELRVWLLGETEETYSAISETFASRYGGVTVSYRIFTDEERYESALLDALAAGAGPDVFMVRNNNVSKYVNKILPAPPTIITAQGIRTLFPQVVSDDFVWGDAVFGLPLSVDTLSLIYNRDLFNEAGIILAPTTWEELTAAVEKLKREDGSKNITRAGAALGGAYNITNATDILSLIMLQTGTEMVNEDYTSALFASPQGESALSFYTQFANARNEFYTWNETLPNDLQAFSQERAAIIFGYRSTIDRILMLSPFINIGISKIPQSQNAPRSIGYASYWGHVVSRQSKNAELAWKFIALTTTDEVMARRYSEKTSRPPALLTIISNSLTNEVYGVFSSQALIARSWPTPDALKTDSVFRDTIASVASGVLTTLDALSSASAFVSSLIPQFANQ